MGLGSNMNLSILVRLKSKLQYLKVGVIFEPNNIIGHGVFMLLRWVGVIFEPRVGFIFDPSLIIKK